MLLLLPLFLLAACGNQNENPRQMVAGENSKTWVASRETNAQGDKQKLSNAEQGQKMIFYANGTFQIQEDAEFQTGRWNYNESQKQLEVTFDDRQDVKEVFHVQELENDNMVLHASDGSTLRLKPE
ncbi:hypothetical protein D770_10975 [Flammeovirgaceae bacterium 311]|nr:hypothetical protein D770_10975 [Flammeovirgaceae bacterium 311]